MNLKTRIAGAVIALALTPAAAASAATMINIPQPLPEQVHSNGTQSGNLITGLSKPGGYFINFSSADTLSTTGNGVAQINGPFDFVTIAPLGPPSANQGLAGFSAIEFSLPDHNPAVTGDPFTIMLDFLGGGTQTINWNLENHNSYEVHADPGQVITSVEVGGLTHLGSPVDFGDIRQIEFAGVVPEPASWMLMLLGLASVGAGLRMARRRTPVLTA